MLPPDNYPDLQYKWSVGRSSGVEAVARGRVGNAIDIAKKEGLNHSGVLVIGPQHGFELLEYQRQGFHPVIGLEVVPSFCEDCRKLGFDCYEGDVEHLTDVVLGPWNVHASHVLEHCYDPTAAVRQIEQVCDQWCFVGVPIELTGGSEGHCNPIRSHEQLKSLFPAPFWREVYYEFFPTTSGRADRYGNVEAMWCRQ